jgi:hypothetical protein
VHVPTHNLARIRIRDKAQVNKLVVRRQVGDICHPDLLNGLGANPLHNHLGSALPLDVPALALIEGLAAQTHMAASPGHTQPLNEPLRENLPKGFFTMRTP